MNLDCDNPQLTFYLNVKGVVKYAKDNLVTDYTLISYTSYRDTKLKIWRTRIGCKTSLDLILHMAKLCLKLQNAITLVLILSYFDISAHNLPLPPTGL